MLNILRSQKVQKKIYIVLAVAVIASFGVSGLLISREDKKIGSAIGRIHGKKITVQDYLSSYKAVDHQARMIYGQSFDQIRPYINMKGEAWDRLLLLGYAKKEGLKVSDHEVVDWIGNQKFLQTKGEFDPRLYKLFVTEFLRVDSRHFEEEVRQTLTIGKIKDNLEKKIQVSDKELENLFSQEKGSREIQYIVYKAETKGAAPTEEDLKKIYPLYESVLIEPAKVKIRYLLVPSNAPATTQEATKDEKSSLDALATQYGLKVNDSPFFSKDQSIEGVGLAKELADQSFALKPKEVSKWITTSAGQCKIELVERKESSKLDFEGAKEALKEIFSHQQSVELSLQKLQDLAKEVKASDFEKFASEQKLEIQSMKDFKRGAYIPGIGPSAPIEKALVSVKEGELSKPVPVPGGAALIRVIKNIDFDKQEFSREKNKYKQRILEEKSQEGMQKLLETLRKDLLPNQELMKDIFPEEEKSPEL